MFMVTSQSVLGRSLSQQSSIAVSMPCLVSKTLEKEKQKTKQTYTSLVNVEEI